MAILALLAIAGTLVLSAAGGTLAPLVHVDCGDVVTTDVKLDSNLNCTDDGLVVGAHNVRINLNGFRIDGDGNAGDYGIDNTGGFDNVKIQNGRIHYFENGVRLDGGAGSNKIADLVVTNVSGDAIFVESGSNANTIADVRMVNPNGRGVILHGDSNTLTGSVITSGGDGFELSSADNSAVSNNSLSGSAQYGILVTGSENVLLHKNTVAGNMWDGIFLLDQSGLVRRNTATGNGGSGIIACTDEIAVRNNTAKWNALYGIQYQPASASSGNSASENGDQDIVVGGCN